MTLMEADWVQLETKLLDLEDQTTPITGAELSRRVTLVEAVGGYLGYLGLAVTFASGTAPSIDMWHAVKHEPLSLGGLRRRDHTFAWARPVTIGHYLDPPGTPVGVLDDIDLVWFETSHELTFRTTLEHWRNLLAHTTDKDEAAHDEWASESSTPSAAWTAFKELGTWLSYTDLETSRLLGIGDKTAYGWRREGHPPQPRLARRLYEAHALVRQLVAVLGVEEARRALARGDDDSPIALIAANRVADAEARFAHLIYSRPSDSSALGASRSGDEDRPTGPLSERLPGGRRRVQARRGR